MLHQQVDIFVDRHRKGVGDIGTHHNIVAIWHLLVIGCSELDRPVVRELLVGPKEDQPHRRSLGRLLVRPLQEKAAHLFELPQGIARGARAGVTVHLELSRPQLDPAALGARQWMGGDHQKGKQDNEARRSESPLHAVIVNPAIVDYWP